MAVQGTPPPSRVVMVVGLVAGLPVPQRPSVTRAPGYSLSYSWPYWGAFCIAGA